MPTTARSTSSRIASAGAATWRGWGSLVIAAEPPGRRGRLAARHGRGRGANGSSGRGRSGRTSSQVRGLSNARAATGSASRSTRRRRRPAAATSRRTGRRRQCISPACARRGNRALDPLEVARQRRRRPPAVAGLEATPRAASAAARASPTRRPATAMTASTTVTIARPSGRRRCCSRRGHRGAPHRLVHYVRTEARALEQGGEPRGRVAGDAEPLGDAARGTRAEPRWGAARVPPRRGPTPSARRRPARPRGDPTAWPAPPAPRARRRRPPGGPGPAGQRARPRRPTASTIARPTKAHSYSSGQRGGSVRAAATLRLDRRRSARPDLWNCREAMVPGDGAGAPQGPRGAQRSASGTRSASAIVSGPARTGRMGSRSRPRLRRGGGHRAVATIAPVATTPTPTTINSGHAGIAGAAPPPLSGRRRGGAGHGEQRDYGGGSEDGADEWTAKLDEASDARL